jgi:hypothetical protein
MIPAHLLEEMQELSPSVSVDVKSPEKELEKYRRNNQLLEIKLCREQNKARRLQPIVSRLENLDNIAMDCPIPNHS